MTDIVERLREYTNNIRAGNSPEDYMAWQAANEIERLRQENAALLASLDKYKEWFPKLIEGGTFPSERDDLHQQNAALLAALEVAARDEEMSGYTASVIRTAIEKAKQ